MYDVLMSEEGSFQLAYIIIFYVCNYTSLNNKINLVCEHLRFLWLLLFSYSLSKGKKALIKKDMYLDYQRFKLFLSFLYSNFFCRIYSLK